MIKPAKQSWFLDYLASFPKVTKNVSLKQVEDYLKKNPPKPKHTS